jgi:hypothetical protein
MLTLYTSKDALIKDYQRPNLQLVSDADSYFDQLVQTGAIGIKDCQFMYNFLTPCTDELTCIMDLLSLNTSCKTLILASKYPDLILTTGNISREAALYMLTLFGNSDRAIVYYVYDKAKESDGLICDVEPQTIIEEDDCIEAVVISEETRVPCHTYGEILKALYYARASVPTSCIGMWDDIFTGSLDIDQTMDDEIKQRGFDTDYDFIRQTSLGARAVPDHACNRASCEERINVFSDCYVVGGQFICCLTYTDDMERVLTIHAPFCTEPTDEQMTIINQYAEKLGYVREVEEDERPDDEVQLSYPIVKCLQQDFKETHTINYYINECGKPQILNVYCRSEESTQNESALRWENLMKAMVAQSKPMTEEDYWKDPNWQHDLNWEDDEESEESEGNEEDGFDPLSDWDDDDGDDDGMQVIEFDPNSDGDIILDIDDFPDDEGDEE